jgi:hypothetical protein
LPQQGVLNRGLEVMGGGSILAGLVLGAIGVFVIERDFVRASAFAFSGAVLTYCGFMHGEAVGVGGGLGVTSGVALAYAVVAAGFSLLASSAPAFPTFPIRTCRSRRLPYPVATRRHCLIFVEEPLNQVAHARGADAPISCAGGPRNAKFHGNASARFVSIRAAERIVRVHYRAIARKFPLKNQCKTTWHAPCIFDFEFGC